jgi:MazG family protein
VDDRLAALDRLIAIVARLREPGGCPWDREQTEQSMAPFVLEEAYEVVDALHSGEPAKIVEEIGDLLMNLVMICRMGEEAKRFDLAAAAAAIADKLVRRHPHVFAGREVRGSNEVLQNWEAIKQAEKREKGEADASVLSGVPAALPSLLRAFRIGEKAARVGFEWPDLAGPSQKVDEELAELRAELAKEPRDEAAVERELGDLLFAAVNLARHLKVNPETALRKTVDRFMARFRHVERGLGERLASSSLAEKDALWEEAKRADT